MVDRNSRDAASDSQCEISGKCKVIASDKSGDAELPGVQIGPAEGML